MINKLILQNFRNYSKRIFEFGEGTTLILGPNAVGKTNILEAIYVLATGKSFRADVENELIKENENFASIKYSFNIEFSLLTKIEPVLETEKLSMRSKVRLKLLNYC